MAIVFGKQEMAQECVRRMASECEAYRKVLGTGDPMQWDSVPILTKKNFYSKHGWRELVPRSQYKDIYSVLRSSGSSGDGVKKGFFWPQLKSQDAPRLQVMQGLLQSVFSLSELSTLAITGMSLGSWAGGEQFAFLFKSHGLQSQHPFVVFSPGNAHEEILEILDEAASEFKQILLVVCPSAIFYLDRMAEQRGKPLPLEKIRFLVTGEPFPESMRLDLSHRAGGNPIVMASVYGSADTGMIGIESKALILVRQLLNENAALANQLGFSPGPIPNLYHFAGTQSFYEIVNEELIVTQWQGIPLLRYNIEDRARHVPWGAIREVLGGKLDLPERMPDVVAISGRSQGCLFLCGSNIFDSMLDAALRATSFWNRLTPYYLVWTDTQKGRQILSWQFEMKRGESPLSVRERDELYRELVQNLGVQQPEFLDDYNRFYFPYEAQGLRIFDFHFVEEGTLSKHPKLVGQIKWKHIVDAGPL